MAKDFIINTSGLNSYGTRVLTPGIDLTQYKRNPVLLYMHTRGFDGKSTPIGRSRISASRATSCGVPPCST